MQTRRDQLQAYRYQVRRLLTALLGSDPESPEQPMRRAATATLAGVMVAVLALVGAGFYGKLHGGSASKWQQAGVLVVERETGSRFVWADDQLHPVLNYTSARLLLSAPAAPVVQVSRRSLEGAPRGRTVGIAGAPDSLPDASHLVVGPWSVCTQGDPGSGSRPAAARNGSVSALMIGSRSGSSGSPLGEQALLVRSGSQLFLVWHGRRSSTDAASLRSIGLDSQQALDVSPGWLNAVPAGVPLRAAAVAGEGSAGPTVGGVPTSVGDLLHVTGAGARASFYVALRDGVAPISAVQAALLSGTADHHQTGAQRVSIADVNAAPQSPTRLGSAELPADPPVLAAVPAGRPVCAESVDATGTAADLPVLTIGGDPLPDPRSSTTTATTTSSASSDRTGVDDVIVGPGTAAVVARLAADGSPTADEYLVTDDGRRYALPSQAAVTALGLAGAHVVGLPSSVLDLLPSGPALDPASALEFAGP